jgi:hypothetical protein
MGIARRRLSVAGQPAAGHEALRSRLEHQRGARERGPALRGHGIENRALEPSREDRRLNARTTHRLPVVAAIAAHVIEQWPEPGLHAVRLLECRAPELEALELPR